MTLEFRVENPFNLFKINFIYLSQKGVELEFQV